MLIRDAAKTETVLITGGAGYIGSNLARRLTLIGHKVIVIDNLNSGLIENLTKEINFFEGDIGDVDLLRRIFSQNEIDIVYHLAARKSVSESMVNPELYMEENVEKTNVLLGVMNEFQSQNLIFASTAAVYGDRDITENGYSETDVPMPTSPYGISKLIAEESLSEATRNSNIKVISFRFFNVAMSESVVSPYIGEDLLSVLKNCIQNGKTFSIFGTDYKTPDGTCHRDFIHMTDLLDALVLGQKYLQRNSFGFSLFNLGSGSGISLSQIAYLGKEILKEGFILEYSARRAGDTAFSLADISAAKKQLGWSPKLQPKDVFTSFFEDLKSN
jgi:UDP-glucose 4-epimerase